jgi:ABC-type transport system involved in multi-copper enzyme maturation permease subunit
VKRTSLFAPTSIAKRELHAALSALFAMLLLQLLVSFAPAFSAIWSSGDVRPEAEYVIWVWGFCTFLIAFILGVLNGAEEEENDTADFVRRLPIPRLRVLTEKLLGSLLAFVLWFAMSVLVLMLVLEFCTARNLISEQVTEVAGIAAYWSVLLFSIALAAGTWVKRVLTASLAGGVVTALFSIIMRFLFWQTHTAESYVYQPLPMAIWLLTILVALSVVVWLYMRDEAATWSVNSILSFRLKRNLFWKERSEKRWLPLALVVAMLLACLAVPISPFKSPPEWIMCNLLIYYMALAAVGMMFISKEEMILEHGFLYQLPLSRVRIVWSKLSVVLRSWLFISLCSVFLNLWISGSQTVDYDSRYVGLTIVAGYSLGLPFLAFCIITSLHFQSRIVAFIVSMILPIPMLFCIFIGSGAYGMEALVGFSLLAAIALVGWLFFLFCRTPFMELSGMKRMLLLLLFSVVSAELAYTFFLCNYRELAFILLGL